MPPRLAYGDLGGARALADLRNAPACAATVGSAAIETLAHSTVVVGGAAGRERHLPFARQLPKLLAAWSQRSRSKSGSA